MSFFKFNVCKSRADILFSLGLGVLSLTGCLQDSVEAPITTEEPQQHLNLAYFTGSDYKSGLLVSVQLDSLQDGPDSLEIYQDSRVKTHGHFVYVLEGVGIDNLMKYDPVTRKVVYQKHLGNRLNPVDMAFINDSTALIAAENSPMLYRCNLQSGELVDSLNLSELIFIPDSGKGDAAVSPHAFAIALHGDTAFVGLQRRNGSWMFSGGNSQVAVVNLKTFTLESVLESQSANASGLWVDSKNVYLISQGEYGVSDDGGIYRWEIATGELSTLVDGAQLSGDPVSFACNEGSTCLVAISKNFGETQVFPLDVKAGKFLDPLPGLVDASGGILFNPATHGWLIGERAKDKAGIAFFDAEFNSVGNFLPLTLPPYSVSRLAF